MKTTAEDTYTNSRGANLEIFRNPSCARIQRYRWRRTAFEFLADQSFDFFDVAPLCLFRNALRVPCAETLVRFFQLLVLYASDHSFNIRIGRSAYEREGKSRSAEVQGCGDSYDKSNSASGEKD